jgi:YD repeat-containing protein
MMLGHSLTRLSSILLVACLMWMGLGSSPVSATDVKNQYWRLELCTDKEVVQPGGVVRYYIRITRLGPPVPEATIEFRTADAVERLAGFSIQPYEMTQAGGWTARWRVQFASKRGLPPYVLIVFEAWFKQSIPTNTEVTSQVSVFPDPTRITQQVEVGHLMNLTNGASPNAANSTEPVQLGTCEYYTDSVVDINLGGPLPLLFSRSYAARLQDEGIVGSALGENWLHNFDLRINQMSWGLKVIYYGGRIIRFVPDPYSPGTWSPNTSHEIYCQMGEEPGGYWLMDPLRDRIFRFDKQSGRLMSIQDRNGNTLSLTYDGQGKLAQVSDGLGRTLTFTYTGTNLTGVSDGTRRVWSMPIRTED